MFRPILALAALAPLSACAQPAAAPSTAATDADPALWVVRDRDTTIYLFGTIHVLKPGLTWFDEAVRKAFDRSREVKLEIVEGDAASTAGLVARFGVAADGPTLTERLPADKRPALAEAMAAIGVPEAGYQRLRPWLAATYLQVRSLAKLGYDPDNGPEKTIAAAARAAGKPLSGLETPEQQLGYFATLSDAAQLELLTSTLDDLPKLPGEIDTIVGEWSRGRTDTIAAELNKDLTESPEAMKMLLFDRNARWAAWIAERMKRPGAVFIAVGAGHLAGQGSVQDRLGAYKLKAVRVRY